MAENFAQWISDTVKGAGKDAEAIGGALSEAGKRIKPSFQQAYADAQAGKPSKLLFKGAGVAVGATLTASGLNNIARGTLEDVEHPAHDGRTVKNTTRIFWGGAEAMVGLSALYFGLTKGQIR